MDTGDARKAWEQKRNYDDVTFKYSPWWRHQMETFPRYWPFECEGNPRVNGGFPSQRPVMQSFEIFFVVNLNICLSKQSRCWWFETPWRSLWRHCNTVLLTLCVENLFPLQRTSNAAIRFFSLSLAWTNRWIVPCVILLNLSNSNCACYDVETLSFASGVLQAQDSPHNGSVTWSFGVCYWPEQTVQLLVIGNVMTLMWRHSND